MPHYKDNENKLHFIDDESFQHLLPAGSVEITDEEAESLRPKPVITLEDLIRPYEQAAQLHMDDFARTRIYADIGSACSYYASTNPKFRAEGAYCVELRDATWAKSYEILAEQLLKYPDGLPTSEQLLAEFPVENFLSMLPELKWPTAA